MHPRAHAPSPSHRSPLLVLFGLLVGTLSAAAPASAQTFVDLSIQHNGFTRLYDLHVPASYDGNTAVALVLDFHGLGSNKTQQQALSGFKARSELAGFIVAWPQALFGAPGDPEAPNGTLGIDPPETLGPAWEAGDWCCGAAVGSGVDDVGFASALVDEIASGWNVDRARVYATGLSNGGGMAHALACEASSVFAASAPVAVPLPYEPLANCSPARPIPVLHFAGLTDVLVPYAGGASPVAPTLVFPSAADSFLQWRTNNGCNVGSTPSSTTVGASTCEIDDTCQASAETGLCSILGTNTSPPYPPLTDGHILYVNDDFDIALEAWNFFDQFTNPVTGSPNVTGSWQINFACDASFGPITGTAFRDFTHDVGTGVVTSTLTSNCGSTLAQGATRQLATCSLSPDPDNGTVTGTQLAVPTAGFSTLTSAPVTPYSWPDVWNVPFCGSTNDVIAGSDVVGRTDYTITGDALGMAIRLDGTASFSTITLTNTLAETCGPVGISTLTCDLVGLPNGIATGAMQTVEPLPNGSLTFDQVTVPGEVEVVVVTLPSPSLPANFLAFPTAFNITTTASFTGNVEVCLPYLDEDDDGFEDTSGLDETQIRLFHEEGGGFVDRTSALDAVNNQVCASVTSFSEFVLAANQGAGGSGCPTQPSDMCSENAKNITLLLDKEAPGSSHPTTGPNARLVFKWVRGSDEDDEAILQSDFGPQGGDRPGGDVHLCFYEDDALQFSMTAPQGGPWSRISDKGFKYVDKGANGIQKLILKGNSPGKAVIALLAKGDSVPVPALPRKPGGYSKDDPTLDRTYDIQLHVDDQMGCYGMSYGNGPAESPEVHVDKVRGDGNPVGVWKIKRTGP